MSEGRISVALGEDPIRPDRVLADVEDPAHGAVALFLGVVRNHHEGRAVERLRYDAYEEMVRAQMQVVAEEASQQAGEGSRVCLVHRTGQLEIGDIAVAVAVSSPHRAEAFAASRYAIDELKLRIPIWKKETFADGDEEWVRGTTPGGGLPAETAGGLPR